MRKSLGICVAALLLTMPLIAEDLGPLRVGKSFGTLRGTDDPSPVAPSAGDSIPQIPVQSSPVASGSGTVHRTVVAYEPYTVVDPQAGAPKTEYRQVSRIVTEKVPTDPAEIETLRKRLKELHERRIESLTPAELATEVSQGAAEAKEREAWTKLQEARAHLLKVSAEFPDTQAARIAVAAQNSIPATERPTSPEPTTPTLNPLPRNPLPTY